MNDVNTVLVALLTLGAGIGLGAWLWPEALDAIAWQCRARAAALRASRSAYIEANKKVLRQQRIAADFSDMTDDR